MKDFNDFYHKALNVDNFTKMVKEQNFSKIDDETLTEICASCFTVTIEVLRQYHEWANCDK